VSEARPKIEIVDTASGPDAPFGVSASERGSRERYALKSDDTFAVIDAHGDINADGAGSDGVFHADTRYLSHLRVTVMGADPLLLGSSLAQDGTYAHADLTNPDIVRDGRIFLGKDQVHIERTVYVHAGGLRQRLMLSNYSQATIDLPVTVSFNNDFADIFEVRGTGRARRGTGAARKLDDTEVELGYMGLDGVARTTKVSFSQPPASLGRGEASYQFKLSSRERAVIDINVSIANVQQPQPKSFLAGLLSARKGFARKVAWCGVRTGSNDLNAALERSAADVSLLMTSTPSGLYPYAGVPWFSTVFGRDGLITALELLWLYPDMARGVLKFLAAQQATASDAHSDAEPGKILHEMRGGEMAARKEVPFGAYYGSVDSTPLFIVLAGHYWQRTGDDMLVRELWPNIEAALRWMDVSGDRDGDGFIEYYRAAPSGLVNQGWKDSGDSISYADGALCRGPVALVEVQAYAYEAKTLAAQMARHLGHARRADELERQAEELKRNFAASFWSDELECFAIALDGDKRPCNVVTSNAGQVLRSGIAEGAHVRKIAAHMLSPQLFSGWGVRTLSDAAVRYNPMSYHNGSIWPHDNALIAAGIARVDRAGAERIFKGLLDAAMRMDQQRLPELFCGFPRRRGRAPVLYPVACSPQAWASGALFYLLQGMLGIDIDGRRNTVRLDRPHIPPWLEHVELDDLAVGNGRVSLRVSRDTNGAAAVTVIDNSANADIEAD
jgi:glycogen debranching enzyme